MIDLALVTGDVGFSQFDEGAKINALLSEIFVSKIKIGVEFGASTGFDNSNLIHLVNQLDKLILIEADQERFRALQSQVSAISSILPINAVVGFTPNKDNLRHILLSHNITSDTIDFLSIDIDGDDVLVWEQSQVSAQVVIIEYNPFFPSDKAFRNPIGENIGNSISEIVETGNKLGYFLAAATNSNVFMVSNTLKHRIIEHSLREIVHSLDDNPRIGWGYNGKLVFYGGRNILSRGEAFVNPWNSALLLQPLPKSLRKFKPDFVTLILQKLYTSSFLLLLRPNLIVRQVFRILRRSEAE